MDSQKKHPKVYSFEFFPPKNEEGAAKLRKTRDELAKLKPRFFSVTFGAGGSTLEALDAVEAEGGKVARVLCLVDRGEGAAEAFAARGIELEALFGRVDLPV